ncbi:MAG: ribonuclease J [Vicinamibacteria bacterium]
MNSDLRITPIGGLGEFGMNSLLLQLGEDRLLIDAGQMFPEWDNGVERMVPDYARLGPGRMHAIMLTHGHEDHIGSLPQALQWSKAPVYGTPFTLGLAQRGLIEAGIEADLRTIEPGVVTQAGPFRIHSLKVAHSTPGAVAFVIECGELVVLHTGDFKLAKNAPVADRTNLEAFAEWGRRGVDIMLGDSTGAETPGVTGHEDDVIPGIEAAFDGADGRVIATCFSSSIPRIERIARVGGRQGRKVAFAGRRILENATLARDLGHLTMDAEVIMLDDAASGTIPARQMLVFAAGSQAEPRSALARMAAGDHPLVKIQRGDLVLFSSRVIPGRDRIVSRLMGRLIRAGARVVHGGCAHVHVSGHAAQDELSELVKLVRPSVFIPMHGELRMLAAHARLVETALDGDVRVHVIENGDVLRVSESSARLEERLTLPKRCLGVGLSGDLSDDLLRERHRLSTAGLVSPIVYLSASNGRWARPCELLTRGFLDGAIEEPIVAEIRDTVNATVREWAADTSSEGLRATIATDVTRLLRRRFQLRPVVAPVLVEV